MIAASAIRQNNVTFIGHRHADIIKAMIMESGFDKVNGEQGFLTHEGIFLNRKEALDHALSTGQIEKPKFQPNALFSEDLW